MWRTEVRKGFQGTKATLMDTDLPAWFPKGCKEVEAVLGTWHTPLVRHLWGGDGGEGGFWGEGRVTDDVQRGTPRLVVMKRG